MGKDQSNFAISRWVSLGFYTIVVHKEYHNFFHFIGNRDRLESPLYAYPLVRLDQILLVCPASKKASTKAPSLHLTYVKIRTAVKYRGLRG